MELAWNYYRVMVCLSYYFIGFMVDNSVLSDFNRLLCELWILKIFIYKRKLFQEWSCRNLTMKKINKSTKNISSNYNHSSIHKIKPYQNLISSLSFMSFSLDISLNLRFRRLVQLFPRRKNSYCQPYFFQLERPLWTELLDSIKWGRLLNFF